MSSFAGLRNAALALATLVLVSPARAQVLEIGASVYLFEPGPVTGTLLAAPSMTLPDFWDSAIFYSDPGTGGPDSESAAALFNSVSSPVVGSAVSTPSIPAQSNSLFISTFFGVAPPPGTQGDATGTFVSTGFTSANNRPAGPIVANAGVIFNADHTALLGFAPPDSATPELFTDFPVRVLLTNVWDGDATPVPEPSTWMLFLTGLLAGGFLLRRRMR